MSTDVAVPKQRWPTGRYSYPQLRPPVRPSAREVHTYRHPRRAHAVFARGASSVTVRVPRAYVEYNIGDTRIFTTPPEYVGCRCRCIGCLSHYYWTV